MSRYTGRMPVSATFLTIKPTSISEADITRSTACADSFETNWLCIAASADTPVRATLLLICKLQ